jgi:cation diffusion facilitator CzcD-associated flavoprotein CzcO
MTRWPWLARLRHDFQWFFFGEMQLTPLMKQVRPVQWAARQYSLLHLRRQVRDPALRARLVPDYPIGAKRVLFNDDYYPTLNRANAARHGPDRVHRTDRRRPGMAPRTGRRHRYATDSTPRTLSRWSQRLARKL